MTDAAAAAKERGAELYRRGDFEGAVEAFSTAIASCPRSHAQLHVFHSNRCAALLNLGRVDQAMKDAEACTRHQPQWAKGWSRLGNCLIRKGRLDAAVSALRKAAELEPENQDTRDMLRSAQQQQSQQAPPHAHQQQQQASQRGFTMPSMPKIDMSNIKYQAQMLLYRIQENKTLMYGLLALVVYLVFFRSPSPRYGRYDDLDGYGGGYGGSGGGWDLWQLGMIGMLCYVGYQQGWHRNLQNMSPMTIYMIVNLLQGLLGGGRGGYRGGYGGYGRPGMGGFGRRRPGFF
mmetsp:Transcript_24652/g.46758  ORF Transcript_24652/g.46758 Transcript_24652/m.46758 type:complete len:289 (+) Transcript_24652:151-1017(+)